MVRYLIALLLVVAPVAAQIIPFSFVRHVTFGGGATYLASEDFEPTGYTLTWTESGAGTIDEDYATSPAPLVGTQSLRLVASAQTVNTYTTFTAQSTLEAYFVFRRVSGSNHRVFSLRNSSGTMVALVIVESSGALTARCGSSGGTSTVTTTATGTTYHVWLRYVKGSGANGFASVGFSTDGTRPTSGNAYAEHTTGNATTDAARVMCGSEVSATFEVIFDKVRVDDATITDNPS